MNSFIHYYFMKEILNKNTNKIDISKSPKNSVPTLVKTRLFNSHTILNNKEKRLTNWGFNTGFEVNKGLPIKQGGKEYINLQSGGCKRVIRYGARGGRYYMKGGKKYYI